MQHFNRTITVYCFVKYSYSAKWLSRSCYVLYHIFLERYVNIYIPIRNINSYRNIYHTSNPTPDQKPTSGQRPRCGERTDAGPFWGGEPLRRTFEEVDPQIKSSGHIHPRPWQPAARGSQVRALFLNIGRVNTTLSTSLVPQPRGYETNYKPLCTSYPTS